MRLLGAPAVFLALFTSVAWARLPASYSLNDHGMIIAIKDQGELGTCWAFSSTTVFEYSLVKDRLLSSERAQNLVSEWDMAIHAGTQFSLVYPYAGWGSNARNALSYLTRGFGRWTVDKISEPAGSGPVARVSSPFNAYPLAAAAQHLDLGGFLPPSNQPTLGYRLVQGATFASKSGDGIPPTPAYRDRIKQAVLDYGALDTSMNAKVLNSHLNKTYDTYAYIGSTMPTDHVVTVIGWNDDQPVYEKDGKLLGYGAWLIQNSWGVGFAPSAVGKRPGCFWLGYMDTLAVKSCVGMVSERRGAISGTVLQNQIFYPDGQAGGAKGTSTFAAARLTPQSDTDLVALALWTVSDDVLVNIDIFPGGGEKGPIGTPLASLRNVMIPQAGYNEVPLRAPISLTAGHAIYVLVSFGSRQAFPIAVDNASLRMKVPGSLAGLSWESTDRKLWKDLALLPKSERGIFPLKGILGSAIVPRKAAVISIAGLRSPLVASGSSITLRGTASNNTRRIYYRVGDTGPIASISGRTAWKLTVRGLRTGRNVVQIWPAAAKGVVTAPLKVTVIGS